MNRAAATALSAIGHGLLGGLLFGWSIAGIAMFAVTGAVAVGLAPTPRPRS